VRTELIDDMTKNIKRILGDSGFVQDQEIQAAMEDNKAVGLMDLEGSGDKESNIEDRNLDPEAGKAVAALKKG